MAGYSVPLSVPRTSRNLLYRPRRDFAIRAGDDFQIELTIYDSDTAVAPADITGAGGLLTISEAEGTAAVVEIDAVMIDAATGRINFNVAGADTTGLSGRYSAVMQVDYLDAISTIIYGWVNIAPGAAGGMTPTEAIDWSSPATQTVLGPLYAANTTESTSTSTGALIVAGGVGIAKRLNVGGATALASTLAVTGLSTFGNGQTVSIGTVSAVSTVQATGATNQTLRVTSAGTGRVDIRSGSGAVARFLDGGASTTWLDVTSGTAGRVILAAGGTATDRSLRFTKNGAGFFDFQGRVETLGMQSEPGTITYTSTLNRDDHPLYVKSAAVGTYPDGIYGYNMVHISGDTTDASGAGVNNGVSALMLYHQAGGAGTQGPRRSLFVQSELTTAFDADPRMAAAQFQTRILAASPGDGSGGPSGTVHGFLADMQLQSGATDYARAYVGEFDVGVSATATVRDLTAIGINLIEGHGTQGTRMDAALNIHQNADSTSDGWGTAFNLGSAGGKFPLDNTTGRILSVFPRVDFGGSSPVAADKPLAAKTGFELFPVIFSTGAMTYPGGLIDGDGSLIVGNGKVSARTGGLQIDAALQKVSAAAPDGGASGTTCFVGDKIWDRDTGTILEIATVNGSNAATSFTIVYAGRSSSPPSNPVAFEGVAARNVDVDLTWTTTENGIYIQPVSGATYIGGYDTTHRASISTTAQAPALSTWATVNTSADGSASGPSFTTRVDTQVWGVAATAVGHWAALDKISVHDTAEGLNLARYMQAINFATGGTPADRELWASVHEIRDESGVASSLSTNMQAIEVDVMANDVDDRVNGSRLGIVVLAGQADTGGAAMRGRYGIVVNRFSGHSANFETHFASLNEFTTAAFSTLEATQSSGHAVWLKTGHHVALNTAGTAYLYSDGTSVNSTKSFGVGTYAGADAVIEMYAATGTSRLVRFWTGSDIAFTTGMGTGNNWNVGWYSGGSFQASAISVSGTDGTLTLGASGSFAANGTVATALSSVGPTGSHTTVQEWLVIKNPSGTTRYIPCF